MAFTPTENDIVQALSRLRLSISEIESKIFIKERPKRRTMQRTLQKLCDNNIIRSIGEGRGRRYEKVDVGK